MTRPPPLLRPFAPADLPRLQQIRAAAFAPVFRSFRDLVGLEIGAIAFAAADAEQARYLEEISAEGGGQELLVAEDAGEIVGFAAFSYNADPARGEIGLNAVHPDHAGRGIGSHMYEEVLARMRAVGVRVVEVGTGGDASHAAARRAYEKAGFRAGIPSITYYRLL